jgi:hypothetical protein
MKKYLMLNLLFFFTIGTSTGQITYTGISFPQAGDVLSIATAVDTLLTVTPASATATAWDFSSLIEVNSNNDTIQPASTGSSYTSFPSSDILRPFVGNLGGTAYVDVTSTQVERIGGGLEIIGLSLIAPFINTHITQIVPLTYPDAVSDTYKWAYGQHIDSIPFLRTLLDSLVALPFGTADSLRVAVEGDESRSVDAWGTCAMADSTYDVIRQKVVTDVGLKIEVYMSVFGAGFWFDATTFLAASLPFPTNTTVVRYDFLAQGVKQPIVSLTLDSAETVVTLIEFLNDTSINNPPTIDVRYVEDELVANIFPNPAQQVVTVQVSADMPVDGYNLYLVDLLGRVVLTENSIRNQNHQVDISSVANGHYVVVLRTKAGKILKRQQLEILR